MTNLPVEGLSPEAMNLRPETRKLSACFEGLKNVMVYELQDGPRVFCHETLH